MRSLLLVVATCVPLVLTGCATQSADRETATALPPTAATQPSAPATAGDGSEAFTSSEYGYTVRLPSGWTARTATSAWDGGDIDHTAPYTDQFADNDGNELFVLGVPTDLDSSAFADEHLAWLSSERGCPAPSRRTSTTVGGTPGVRVSIHCPEGVFGPTLVSKVIAVHDGNALVLTAFSPDSGSDAMPTLDDLASSLRWSTS